MNTAKRKSPASAGDNEDRLPDPQRVQGVQAIRRAFQIIRLVARFQRHTADLQTIAQEAGLSTSTAFRMLKCLTEERMIIYNEATRGYTIGPLAYELGVAAPLQVRAADKWLPTLKAVAAATGYTTYLMARADLEAVCLAQVQGSTPIRAVPLEVGERLPLGLGAGSLAILASLTDREANAIIDANAKGQDAYGKHTTASDLRQRLEAARSNGFGYSAGTVVSGIVGVGVAIPSRLEANSLAISISVVLSSLKPDEQKAIYNTIVREIAAAGK